MTEQQTETATTAARLTYYAQEGITGPDGQFEVVVVQERESGYYSTGYYRPTIEAARDLATRLNTDLGLSEEDTNAIVSSSMAASFSG